MSILTVDQVEFLKYVIGAYFTTNVEVLEESERSQLEDLMDALGIEKEI